MTHQDARGKATELERELREQPAALRRVLEAELGGVEALASTLRKADVRWVLIAARGSSDNAARYSQYLFRIHHGLPVALATRRC